MKSKSDFQTALGYCTNSETIIPRIEEITAYIRKVGWKKIEHSNQNLLVFQGSHDDRGEPIKLVLPSNNDFSDSAQKIKSVIEVLSRINDEPINITLQKIKNIRWDIFRQRIFSNNSINSLPLELAPKIVEYLRDTVYYAACAEEDAQPFFDRKRKIGKDITNKCRFGHTFQGSFGLSIEMPIPPNPSDTLAEELEQPPFERRIMQRIIRGIQNTVKSVREGDVRLITNNYKSGFNANLCETMLCLTQDLKDYNIEFNVSWSPEFKVTDDLILKSPIHMETVSVMPYLESAAKSLRGARESQETEIIGNIVQLRAEAIDEEDQANDRLITIQWEMSNNRKVHIRAALSPEEYRLACDAHRDNNKVNIKGRPEKQGKYWYLTSPHDFVVIPENETEKPTMSECPELFDDSEK